VIRDESFPGFSSLEIKAGLLALMPQKENITQNYLMTFNLGLFASRKYLEKFGTPQSLRELDNHRILTFQDEHIPLSLSNNIFLTQDTKTGQPRTPYLIVNTVPLTVQAAKKDLGIAVLQKESSFVKESGLQEVLPNTQGPQLQVFYTYHKTHEDNEIIKRFEKHLRNYIQSQGWK